MHFAGRTFSSLIASDVVRDGMSLEIWECVTGEEKLVGEVFFSDETQQLSVSLFEESLPLELIEFMGREARERLVLVQEVVGGT
jgi:hypothetical protein